MYDIIIIGAGVTGCAVARYLSRYEGKMLVLEKAEDVCCGTSKANSAIVHAGFDAAHGSLMAKMNLEGNLMMPQLAKDLDFAFKMNGSLVVCMSEEDLPKLHALYENGVKNGVKGLEIVDAKRLHELEPNVSKNAVAALWAPTGGIVCPFNLTIALAENAFDNIELGWNRMESDICGMPADMGDGFLMNHLRSKLCQLVGLTRLIEGGRIAEASIICENKNDERSEERRVGKECRSRWSPYH